MLRSSVVALLAFSACFSFDAALDQCRSKGGCRDAGSSDAGAVDAGSQDDSGTVDAGVRDAGPVQFSGSTTNSQGWTWEFPVPTGASLVSALAIGADEVWALGEDSTLVHVVGPNLTVSRTPASPTTQSGNQCLLASADGGITAYEAAYSGPTQRWSWNGATWTTTTSVPGDLVLASCAVGVGGAHWLGGHVTTECGQASAVIYEGTRARCVLPGDHRVLALDSHGFGLSEDGTIVRRSIAVDGGSLWSAVAAVDAGTFIRGALLELAPETLVVAGPGSAFLVSLDGGSSTQLAWPLPGADWYAATLGANADFFVGGELGIIHCSIAAPSDCQTEFETDLAPVFSLTRVGATVYASGRSGLLLRRDGEGHWVPLIDGNTGGIHDMLREDNGDLWAVTHKGFVLHRTGAGWHRFRDAERALYTLLRTNDGRLWVGGSEFFGEYLSGPERIEEVPLRQSDGGVINSLRGTGQDITALAGGARNNTWAVGSRFLFGYDGMDWVEEPATGGKNLTDAWVSDAGTAWVVGGYTQANTFFFDGHAWKDVSPSAPSGTETVSVWGAGPDEVYVGTNGVDGFRYFADGGHVGWTFNTTNQQNTYLAGGLRADGKAVVFSASGNLVSRGVDGGHPTSWRVEPPGDEYLQRVRVFAGRVYVAGGRDQQRAYLLSYDAGL